MRIIEFDFFRAVVSSYQKLSQLLDNYVWFSFKRLTHDDIEQNIVQQPVPEHSGVEKSVLKCSSGEQGELKKQKFAVNKIRTFFWDLRKLCLYLLRLVFSIAVKTFDSVLFENKKRKDFYEMWFLIEVF